MPSLQKRDQESSGVWPHKGCYALRGQAACEAHRTSFMGYFTKGVSVTYTMSPTLIPRMTPVEMQLSRENLNINQSPGMCQNLPVYSWLSKSQIKGCLHLQITSLLLESLTVPMLCCPIAQGRNPMKVGELMSEITFKVSDLTNWEWL